MVDGLFVKGVGRGPRVVLLHAGVLAGEPCWTRQLPLAGRGYRPVTYIRVPHPAR